MHAFTLACILSNHALQTKGNPTHKHGSTRRTGMHANHPHKHAPQNKPKSKTRYACVLTTHTHKKNTTNHKQHGTAVREGRDGVRLHGVHGRDPGLGPQGRARGGIRPRGEACGLFWRLWRLCVYPTQTNTNTPITQCVQPPHTHTTGHALQEKQDDGGVRADEVRTIRYEAKAMDGCMDAWTDAWMDAWMDRRATTPNKS